nr:MAG TPA: hypothetical protein [Caudoviricetes sp.]
MTARTAKIIRKTNILSPFVRFISQLGLLCTALD